jgi:hypothetical protein
MIPSGWVKDPRRSFADYDGRLQDAPAMLSEVLALARDPPGVEAAEALAWEAMARVAPWGLAAPQTLVWSSTLVPGRATCDAMISLGKCLETTFPQQTPAITRVLETWLPPWEAPFEAARGRVQSLLLWHALYCEAAVRGLALTPREGGMSARCTPGQSPFLAALGVWQRGYGYGGADGAWLNLQVHTEQEV